MIEKNLQVFGKMGHTIGFLLELELNQFVCKFEMKSSSARRI
jgi:hypothetical protein